MASNALHAIPGKNGTGFSSWRPFIGNLLLVMLLLGGLTYTFIWLWRWDGTDDGLRGLVILAVSGTVSFSAGMIIAVTSSGWKRWAGFLFPALVIILLSQAGIGIGNRFSNYTITEQRALRIQEAIENHRAATGSYPASLAELVPGELWRIPFPMIIPDQDWCYESGPDHYRLGLVYRDHWSSPYLDLRVYASAGNVPETGWVCDEKLAEVMSQSAMFGPPPTPVPLPTSAVSVPRIIVEPILQAGSFSVGSWSLDGKTLVFGLTGYSGDPTLPVQIDLRFINGETGEICHPEKSIWKADERSDGMYEHYAWLPDGRFLYVSESGEMAIVRPCVAGWEDLPNRDPVMFTQVASFHAESGHILLKNQDSYGLMDSRRFEVQPISEVAPTTIENQKDLYSWSPSGDRVAISSLIAQDTGERGIIYIIDGGSGEAVMSIPLLSSPDHVDSPVVDWLNQDEILVHFADSLMIMNLQADPPAATDLIREKFLLDLSYPIDFSSMDFVRNVDGNGYDVAVRVNHPHNQDVYLYSSDTGQVNIFPHDTHSLFFFPDGQCLQLSKWDDETTYRDVYEMVWMDRITERHLLVVESHVPRSIPQMFPKCLPRTSRLVFNSSQGISLVSLPDGKTIRFWELAGRAAWNAVFPSPSEETLIIAADRDGLYYIPLPPE